MNTFEVNDTKQFTHGSEGTHGSCNARLKAEGGKARCCQCVPHDGCEDSPTPTDGSFETELDMLLPGLKGGAQRITVRRRLLAAHLADKERAVREARIDELNNILDVAKRNQDALGWEAAYSSVCDVAAIRLAELQKGNSHD